MSGLSVVRSPWKVILRELVTNSTKLSFASPFIKSDAVDAILEGNLEIRGITAFNLCRFVNGASDLAAVEKLLDRGATLYSLWNLHAKVYAFDYCAIVTSANLTTGGLIANTEYGVMIRDEDQVNRIKTDLDGWVRESSRIDREWTESAKKLCDKIPIDQRKFRRDIVDEIPLEDDAIVEALSGWTREVFTVLCDFTQIEFTLPDIYAYEKRFSVVYPNNRNVKAKIRQTLQYLRDMGLVQFVRPGVYRRMVTQAR